MLFQMLKWILWIVLWILLVILLLLLLILFVPVRYRLEGEYSEKRKLFLGKISWFLSLVSITLHYEETLVNSVKILGITIYDSSRSGKPKKEKQGKRKKKEKQEKRRKKEKKPDQKTGEKQTLKERAGSRQPEISVKEAGSHKSLSESEQQKTTFSIDSFYDNENNQAERKSAFWDKLKGTKQKFSDIIEKVKAIWQSVENKLDLIRYYYQLWKKEDTQTAWNKAKARLGKSFVPFIPRKWTVTGIVGFDDPSTTGQMMAIIGMAYPIHGGNLIITPDFEESRTELKVTAGGKITSGVILYHMLHILCDKDCRTLIKLLLAGGFAKEQDEADRIDGNNKQ